MNQKLLSQNFLNLPGFLSGKEASAIAEEFREYAVTHGLKGDQQAANSSSCYNHVSFVELLCEKTPIVSELIGEKVFPTYAYGRVYRKGDDLKPHKDRDSCEISLTVTLFQKDVWPIHIKTPSGDTATLTLAPGDAMLYLGCDAEHWRDTLEEEEHVQVFLHYVRSRGPRSSFLFDAKNGSPRLATKQTTDLSSYIMYMEDLLPADLVQEILAEYANTDEWIPTKIGGNGGVVNPTIRGAHTISLSIPETLNKNFDRRKQLDEKIFACVSSAIKQYGEKYPDCKIVEDSGYELLRYVEGTGYSQHVDNFTEFPRAVSCSIALNDDYEGGEFTFFDQTISYKQAAGSALLFPSSFQYPHQVNLVKKGTRFSIVTWFR